MEENELIEYWTDLIDPIFPSDGKMHYYPAKSNFYFDISWRRETGFNKFFPAIQIIIEREFIEDYLGESERIWSAIDDKLIGFIKSKLSMFNPHPDKPVEIWYVPSTIIRDAKKTVR